VSPSTNTPEHYLSVAKKHLEKVREAWPDPTDWDDLSTYGLYCLEACVTAAALKRSLPPAKQHWRKAYLARDLHGDHGLPNIRTLLEDLNEARKANAYGDEEFDESEFDAQNIATRIEDYFNQVSVMV